MTLYFQNSMTFKNAKITLFASLIAVMILPFSGLGFADAKPKEISETVTKERFLEAVERVHDLRNNQTKTNENVSITAAERAERLAHLDDAISRLIPILDRYEEQRREAYFIEPDRRAYLTAAEESLRYDVREKLVGKADYFSVNLNERDRVLEIRIGELKHKPAVEKILAEKYPDDIDYDISVEQYRDLACASQTDDCDPIVGGVEIEGDCSLGLPVKKGFWIWTTYHFITAGHCIADGQDMNQPDETSGEIGDSTDSHYVSDCDCAMSDKTTGTASNSKVWRSSNNYLSITSESTGRPTSGTQVAVFGVTSGFQQGEVDDPNHTFTYNGIDWDLVQIDITLSGGDSGAPVTNAAGNQIFGIIKGTDGSGTDYSPWNAIDSKFGGLSLH